MQLQREDVVRVIRRVGLALLALAVGATAGAAQSAAEASRQAYFGAVAEFFGLPRSEVIILGEWKLPPDEIPVILFVARRAGVSPEALVALRESGRGWADLSRRYGLDASHFHVPLPAAADPGRLAAAYQGYRTLPTGRWKEIVLADGDIVGLVNLRILAQSLGQAPEGILARAGSGSWAEAYLLLIGDVQRRREVP
jgi:hypothetical protein